MGKRLIIQGANFATNGIKMPYIDKEVTTEQGYVVQTDPKRRLAESNNLYVNVYVKSNAIITLHPGDKIALMPNDKFIQGTIYAYTSVTQYYPSYTPSSNTVYVSSNSPYVWATATTFPVLLTNTHPTKDLYIVLQGRGGLNNALSPVNLPKIAYRIFSWEHIEDYEDEEEWLGAMLYYAGLEVEQNNLGTLQKTYMKEYHNPYPVIWNKRN